MLSEDKLNEEDMTERKQRKVVFTVRVHAGPRRTYFIDIVESQTGEYYVSINEASQRLAQSGRRQRINIYKEDISRFIKGLQRAYDKLKDDLMPDYDFERFDRIEEERRLRRLKAIEEGPFDVTDYTKPFDEISEGTSSNTSVDEEVAPSDELGDTDEPSTDQRDDEEDMSW